MGRDGKPPLWRDRGLLHCRPLCWTGDRTDQNWCTLQVTAVSVAVDHARVCCQLHQHSALHCRSERLAKYNQLLRIEEELGSEAVYAGETWRFISW